MNNETNRETKRFMHTLNLQLFAEGDPELKYPQDPPADPPKTFTQAELDDVVAKRLERERKKYERYSDYDDIKTRLAEIQAAEDERKRGELTEIERIKADLERESGAKQTLESELTTLRESVKQERIRNAFISAATTAKIAYIDDAWALADKTGISVGDDGNVSGVDDVIKALVENKPFLVEQKPKQPKTIGGATENPPAPQKTAEQLLKEAADKAKKSGKTEDQAAYAKLKRELGL